jgi:hypothetical protein
VDMRLPAPQGCEEAQPLDVIEVQMSEKEVNRFRPVRSQLESQRVNPGSGIEDEQGIVAESNFNAGCISPIADRSRTWSRERSAATPDRQAQARLLGLASFGLLPEDCEHPHEPVGLREKRNPGDGDHTRPPVEASDTEDVVGRLALEEGDS